MAVLETQTGLVAPMLPLFFSFFFVCVLHLFFIRCLKVFLSCSPAVKNNLIHRTDHDLTTYHVDRGGLLRMFRPKLFVKADWAF